MRYDEDTKLLLTEVHDHAAHDAAALPDASFFPDNLLLPAGGEDKITLMVLADSGELLILSGYNLARDHHALYLFLTELLENVSMDGAAVYVAEDAAATASPEV